MSSFQKVYVKDFDGNILTPPTIYYFEEKQPDGSWKEIEVLAHDHDSNPNKYIKDKQTYRFINNDKGSTYQNCMDYFHDPRHKWPTTLSQDIIQAFEKGNFAPSFAKFRDEVLVNAELFAIFTAREHSPDTLKVNMQRISDLALTLEQKEQQLENIKKKFWWEKESDAIAIKKYFDINIYRPVNNSELAKFLGMDHMSTAQRKVGAMGRYIPYVADIIRKYDGVDENDKIKLGFSDDGFVNIYEMVNFFASLYDSRYNRWFVDYPDDFFEYKTYYTGAMTTEQVSVKLESIKDKYPLLSIQEEDRAYANQQGIWMPTTKISITRKAE